MLVLAVEFTSLNVGWPNFCQAQYQFQLEEGSAQATTIEQQLREALRAGGEQVRQLQDSEARLLQQAQALGSEVCSWRAHLRL